MGLFRAVIVLAAAAAVAGGVLYELRQLAVVSTLPPREALARYEKRRRRSDRVLVLVTVGLALVAAGALTYHLLAP